MTRFVWPSVVLLAWVVACGTHGGDAFDGFVGVDGQPYEPAEPAFCDWYPVRSNATAFFSEPLSIAEGDRYEISISAAFENLDGEFVYPDPLVCSIQEEGGRRTGSCPEFTPTDAEFSFDGVPHWEYNDDGEFAGFRWYRLAGSAEIRLTRNDEVLFDGAVELDATTSECPEHVFDRWEEHPEYGETYRYAEVTIDTSP